MAGPINEGDLYEIYKSEVTGEALFTLAASLSVSREKRLKWGRLAQLETQTKRRYLSYIDSSCQKFVYPAMAYLSGKLFGLIFAVLPWSWSMTLLSKGTSPLIKVFERLCESADEPDKGFFEYVLAHERAIAEFALLELAGDSRSLEAVDQLLEI